MGIVLTVAFFLFITFWWMRCYTKHGESLQVHDYIGMQLEDAIEKAEKRSFNIVVSDSTSIPELPPFQIIDQKPEPLSRVKEDRTIYLQIVKSKPDDVQLPSIVGNDNYNQYKNILSRRKIKSKIKERVYNEKYQENTILHLFYGDQKITFEDIRKGVEVPQGSTLEFVVTERAGGTLVDMPELVCLPYNEAQFVINNYQLNIGSVIPDATIKNKETAYIWKQRPAYTPSATTRVGSQIDLYITQYRPDDCN